MSHATYPSLRVCVEVDGDAFVAQCVDYDIAASGSDIESAIQAFIRVYMKHVLVACELGLEPLSTAPPARPEYAEKWRRAAVGGPNRIREFTIPAFAVVKQGQEVPAGFFKHLEAAVPCDIAA